MSILNRLCRVILWVSTLVAVCVCSNVFDHEANELAFASYYGSHMVLQMAPKKATIWGVGWIGRVLVLTISNSTYHMEYNTEITEGFYPDINTKAGVWSVLLDEMPAGGPYSIRVQDDIDDFSQIDDVLFGDVWLCAGQSNMQFTMSMAFNATEEIASADNYPDIRVFTLGQRKDTVRNTDVRQIIQPWSVSSKAAMAGPKWGYFSAVCWFYGRYLYNNLKYPIGLVSSTWGGTAIELWSSPRSLKRCGIPSNPHNSVIWNTMINPFFNMTIMGVIWYQGESNANSPDSYNCTFPNMIDDWRTSFSNAGQTDSVFPFGFVQLAPNRPPTAGGNTAYGFPDIRWHQTADVGVVPNYKLPKVFMAVTMDLPDYQSPFGPIHPRYKQDVSERLGLAALGVAYGRTTEYQALMPSAFYVDIVFRNMTIEFDKGKRPLEVRSKTGFEICCSSQNITYCPDGDAHWVPATITGSTNTSVTILYKTTCDGKWVVGLRYAWMESPCSFKKCPLYDATNKLPVPPFTMNGIWLAKEPVLRSDVFTWSRMKDGKWGKWLRHQNYGAPE